MKLRLVIIFALFVGISLFVFSTDSNALSPELRFEMLKVKLVEQLKAEEYSAVLTTMDEIKALGVPLPKSFTYFEGKALYESGNKSAAYTTLEKYVEGEGKGSKYFSKAIAYLVKAEGAYKAEKQKEIEKHIAAEREAEIARQKETLLREEAKEFSTLSRLDKVSEIGQMWTSPVPKKYKNNPFLQVKVYGTAQQAKDYCQNQNIGCYDDWRVPAMKEFSTITRNESTNEFMAWENSSYHSVWVWGSPEFSEGNKKFEKSQLYQFLNDKNAPKYVNSSIANIMCVRTDSQEKFDNYFNRKYTVLEHDDIKIMVEDRYMVKKNKCYYSDDDVQGFDTAINYCEKLTLGGYDNWRVPTENDMLINLPCNVAEYLYFMRNAPPYNKLWLQYPSLFGNKPGAFSPDICEINEVASSRSFMVRCVRDVD